MKPHRLNIRNETDLPIVVEGVEQDGQSFIVVRVSDSAKPSGCAHPVPELHCPLAGQPIEWCRCCGSYRIFEDWISPQGSLQHRALQMGKLAAALVQMQRRMADIISECAKEVRGL